MIPFGPAGSAPATNTANNANTFREAVERLAATWEADDEEHLNRFGQHLMGGAVLSCAEHLRALLAQS